MESLTKSHIYAVPNIYAISKTIIYLQLQSLIILFCLTLTLNLAINSNTSQSKQINHYRVPNLNFPDKLEDIPVKVYQGFKEMDRIEDKNNSYSEKYNYYTEIKTKLDNKINNETGNIENRYISDNIGSNSDIKTTYASWYGPRFYGKRTANGEIFTKDSISFAHKNLPFGTKVKFYYNGKTVIAYCNDRGPFRSGREFDLSYRVAKILGFSGIKLIKYKILDDSEKENKEFYEFFLADK